MTTYCIKRFVFKGEARIIKTGLTLEEAQAHCEDPETSSKSCSEETADAEPGLWFDGYEREDA